MKRKLGWKPDLPDKRDHLYSEKMYNASFPVRSWWPCHILSGAKSYPLTADLRGPLWPEIFDQGELGSCVENAWCAALSYLDAKEGDSSHRFSRLFLYYNVRGGSTADDGSTIRSGIKSVASMGVCNETLWPYDTSKWLNKPDPACYTDATPRKDIHYASLLTLDDFLNCIASGYPIVYGMSLYESFNNVSKANPTVPLPADGEAMIGGHATCLLGYDLNDKVFLGRNSWGTDWGMDGYFYIPFDYVCDPTLADDFWTCQFIPEEK